MMRWTTPVTRGIVLVGVALLTMSPAWSSVGKAGLAAEEQAYQAAPMSVPLPPPPGCAVTLANGRTPPGEKSSGPRERAAGHHGNGAIWTALWPNGTVLIPPDLVQPDGALSMKFPWWRAVKGYFLIQGERLDAPAPPMQAWGGPSRRLDLPMPPSEFKVDYTETGFQASELIFPTEGCWRVTATVGESQLTFVTRVVKVERWSWDTEAAAAES